MDILKIIDEELDKLNFELIKKIRENDSLIHFIRNFIVNIMCDQIHLEINFDKVNKSFCKKNNIQTEEGFSRYLEMKGMIMDDHKRNLINGEKIFFIAKDKFSKKAESDFIENKDILSLYTYDLISIFESDFAHEIYFQLESEELDIKNLEGEQYALKSKLKISSFGPNDLVKTSPILREKLINLGKGEISYPFKFNNFWIILNLKEKEEAEFNDFIKSKMVLALFDNWITLLSIKSVKRFLV